MKDKAVKKVSDNLDMFAGGIADKMINFFQKNNERNFIIAAHKKNGDLAVIPALNRTTIEIGNNQNSLRSKDSLIEIAHINLPEKPENMKDMSDFIIGVIFGISTLIDDNLNSINSIDELEIDEHGSEFYDIPNKIIKKSLKPAKLITTDDYLFFKLNILNDYSSRMLLGCVKDVDIIMENIASDISIVNGKNGIFEAVMNGRCSPIYPSIKPEEKIFIDTNNKKIVDGEIYVCCLIESIYSIELNMYRVFKKGNGIFLKADNPSLSLYKDDDKSPVKYVKCFKDKLIKSKDVSNVIIGRVVEVNGKPIN